MNYEVFPMAAPAWTELDNLTHAISDLRVRQEAAKSVGSADVAATIEQEIAQLEERRNQLLAELAQGVVKTAEPSNETRMAERPSTGWDQLTPADMKRAGADIN